YDPRNEHDSCGIGFVANIKGRKSHDIIARGLQALVNLDHRGAVGADPLVGDGAGCLIQTSLRGVDGLCPKSFNSGRLGFGTATATPLTARRLAHPEKRFEAPFTPSTVAHRAGPLRESRSPTPWRQSRAQAARLAMLDSGTSDCTSDSIVPK